MSNLFDENSNTFPFGKTDDDAIDKADFKITNDASLYQQNAGQMPGLAATSFPEAGKPQTTPDFSFDGKGRNGFQANHGFYPAKTDFSGMANPVKPVPKVQETNASQWGTNWLARNMNNANTDNPAHNAAVRAMEKMERGDGDPRWFQEAERLDKMLYEPSRIKLNAVPGIDDWGKRNQDNSPSFRAVSFGMESLEKDNARLKRVGQLEQVLKSRAQQARNQDEHAKGMAGYQNAYQAAAHEGTYSYDQLENIAQLYGQPIGKIANQLGLSWWKGVYEIPPMQLASTLPHLVNYVFQSHGGDKVMATNEDFFRDLEITRRNSFNFPVFTGPDGKETGVGTVTRWFNKLAEFTPSAVFTALAGATWGGGVTGAITLPGAVSAKFFSERERGMTELNRMPEHKLFENAEFCAHYDAYKKLARQYNLDSSHEASVRNAKTTIAGKKAGKEAAKTAVTEVVLNKLAQAVPEEHTSLAREILKTTLMQAVMEEGGAFIQKLMQSGNTVGAGDTAW